jgi:DNA-binding XRE family transcriptional regulator
MGLSAAYIHDTKKETKRKQLFPRYLAARDIFSSISELKDMRALILEKDRTLRQVLNGLAHAGSGALEILQSLDLVASSSLRESIDDTVHNLFRTVIRLDPKTDLSIEEISEVFRAEHPEHYIIGGYVDHRNQLITLYRGDLKPVLRTFGSFAPNATSKPDFKKFKVVDGGLSIQFGENYEASTFPIMYEADPKFRKHINKQRKKEDRSFGACLYRARKMKGFKQSDLGVPRETIHRIENDKISTVQQGTKKKILAALNMTEEELLGF